MLGINRVETANKKTNKAMHPVSKKKQRQQGTSVYNVRQQRVSTTCTNDVRQQHAPTTCGRRAACAGRRTRRQSRNPSSRRHPWALSKAPPHRDKAQGEGGRCSPQQIPQLGLRLRSETPPPNPLWQDATEKEAPRRPQARNTYYEQTYVRQGQTNHDVVFWHEACRMPAADCSPAVDMDV